MNEGIQYFEICFSNGNSEEDALVCIKGKRQPTVDEANKFYEEDVKLYDSPIVSVVPIDVEEAKDSYNFDDEVNWPVFGE